MKSYDVAVIPGDGVGKEVAQEAVKILRAVADKYGFTIKTETYDWGCDYYLKHGEMGPENMLEILKPFDAIFLGCIGDASKVPDHISLTLLLRIRKGFDQYVNLRPIRLYPGVETPIRDATHETVDMVVVRENTEGEYSAVGGLFKLGYIEREIYDVYKHRYSEPLVKKVSKPLTLEELKEQEKLKRLQKHFSAVLKQWPTLREKAKKSHIVKAKQYEHKIPNAKLVLALASGNSKQVEEEVKP